MSFHLSMKRASVCVHSGHDHTCLKTLQAFCLALHVKREIHMRSLRRFNKGQEGSRRLKKVREGSIRFKKAQRGSGRLKEVQEGSTRFRKAQGSSRRLKKVQKGSRRFKKAQEDSRQLQEVQDSSASTFVWHPPFLSYDVGGPTLGTLGRLDHYRWLALGRKPPASQQG